MPADTFDSLAYFEKLKSAGVPEEQAKVHAQAIREFADSTLATKRDLRELELRLKYDLTMRLGGIVVACSAILLAALPLLVRG